MTPWEVVGVIVVLVGLITAITGPTLKLCNTIAKLSVLIDGALNDMKELKETDKILRKDVSESHRRIHDKISKSEILLQKHEVRICNLEQKE